MKLLVVIICLIYVPAFAVAASIDIKNLNSQSSQLFSQLLSEQTSDSAYNAQAAAIAMSSLLDDLAPSIKQIPGYAGLFAGNCSVFFSNKTIEQVGCNIIPVAAVSVDQNIQINSPTRLPQGYATQITQSNILLASLFADWSRKIAQKVEQFQLDLFLQAETCTRTMSTTETQSASKTSLSETLSKTAFNSSSLTELLSKTASASKTILPSVSRTQADSETATKPLSQTESASQTVSQTLPETVTNTLTRMSGLLAAWNSSSGAYEDGTSQLGRYNASNGVVTDTFTGLQWQQASSNTTMSWDDAVLYCVNQATAGFTDWQLPNVAELESLVDYTIPYQGSVSGINAVFSNTPTNYFWSSTPLAGYFGVWYVSYGQNACYSGQLFAQSSNLSKACGGIASQGFVRCLRSPYRPVPVDRYVTSTSTATDILTNLVWQRTGAPSAAAHTDAFTYCNNLHLPDFSSSWRLPRVKELSTLLDYSVPLGKLTMDKTVFTGVPPAAFWSSTVLASSPSTAWFVFFSIGLVGVGATPANGHYVRCVACSVPPTTGVLAAWSQAGGTYEDSTNQTGRYNVSNGIVTDTLTGIQWQRNASSIAMNWTDALAYCANQTTGGLNGWRVPNVGELMTLVDFTNSTAPYINGAAFPNSPVSDIWSSTPDVGNTGIVWDVQFHNRAYPSYYNETTLDRVRCARSCYTIPPTNRYTVNSGAVNDTVTGLLWQQRSTGGTMNQTDALKHCSVLSLPGYSSVWRLPTVKELLTLADYSLPRGNLRMNSVFAGEPASGYWPSTMIAGTSYGWLIVGGGGLNMYNISTLDYARCVACSAPPAAGVLAIWNQAGGTYADSTNQPGRYNVLNGIVTDTLTGIQWQQNASATAMNWTDAKNYCANQTTGGLSGWRVPNIGELQTLVDETKGTLSPYAPVFLNTPVSSLWSSTRVAGDTSSSWEITNAGRSWSSVVTTLNQVRCVRSCYFMSPAERYILKVGAVTDTATGLVWQRTSTGGPMTLANAS
ncbi:MAG: DUF1566 domain-containing protein, partial [Myxococcaceae bacterium]